jgi:hypothetical protein
VARLGGRGNVEVRGLRELQAGLRAIDSKAPGDLRKGLKSAAELVAEEARSLASSAGGVLAKSADSIKAQAQQRDARISWGSARIPYAAGAIMGAVRWKQFEEWRGNSWSVGVAGTGPRAVNDAVASKEDELVEAIGDVIEDLAHRAFPR